MKIDKLHELDTLLCHVSEILYKEYKQNSLDGAASRLYDEIESFRIKIIPELTADKAKNN